MGVENPRMIYTALTEAFFTYLKVSFYAGLFVSFPIIAGQIYKFAAPGLYKNERRAFLPFLVATPLLFALGAALVYYGIFPLAWKFFLSFQTPSIEMGGLAIQLEAKVNEYLSLVLKLIFGQKIFVHNLFVKRRMRHFSKNQTTPMQKIQALLAARKRTLNIVKL